MEYESWTVLEELLEASDKTLGDHMAMFAQRSALLQADAADRQARSSGQLTKIATFIVPCTFVASISSMNGEFAAGERFFYVYWVVSIPITVLLLIWVMVNDPNQYVCLFVCLIQSGYSR
jgi:Mg2+ and Co2+ transporter CorA